jgi:DNA modification methylase
MIDLNFKDIKEAERTKHVHRLHPYKGKFIPQLVEYFLKDFKPKDFILDPFCGSGTTLVQCKESGFNSIGIELSKFNSIISNVKVSKYDISEVEKLFNYFKTLNYSDQKILEMDKIITSENYEETLEKFGVTLDKTSWFLKPVQDEINIIVPEIKNIQEESLRNLMMVVFSRTLKSCRATYHSDLVVSETPVTKPYYCRKHKRVCKPIFTLSKLFNKYLNDSLKRIKEFDKINNNLICYSINGDSREVSLPYYFDGMITSPPYLGVMNYHEQFSYLYDLFDLNYDKNLEIGQLKNKKNYIEDISQVFLNVGKYLKSSAKIIVIANDKDNLYPTIFENSRLKLIEKLEREVSNRVQRNSKNYNEQIFILKKI